MPAASVSKNGGSTGNCRTATQCLLKRARDVMSVEGDVFGTYVPAVVSARLALDNEGSVNGIEQGRGFLVLEKSCEGGVAFRLEDDVGSFVYHFSHGDV